MNGRLAGSALVLLILGAGLGTVSAQGERVFAWEATVQGEGKDGRLRRPVAVAAGPENELAAIDVHEARLVVFRYDGASWKHDRSVSLPGPPSHIAHDGERYLISLRGKRSLMAVEGSRHLLRDIAVPEGMVPGAVCATPGGGFLVHDLAGQRVYRLDRAGQATPFAAVRGHVTALAALPGGGFYAAIPDQSAIERFGANGDRLDRFEIAAAGPVPVWPAGLSVVAGGAVVVVDRHAGRLLMVDGAGNVTGTGSRRGRGSGLLLFPRGVTALGDGRLAVADEGNGRVQVFRRIDDESLP